MTLKLRNIPVFLEDFPFFINLLLSDLDELLDEYLLSIAMFHTPHTLMKSISVIFSLTKCSVVQDTY